MAKRANQPIERPSVWEMIKEAMLSLNRRASYSEIKEYINLRWRGINQDTIVRQIIVLSVNHNSRIHYPENHKPRLTTSGSDYDLLYHTDRGEVELYDANRHGVYEIFTNENGALGVRIYSQSESVNIYSPADILWFKNVTDNETGEAYLEEEDNNFVLNFPNKHKLNALSAQIDELVLVYQKVHGVPAFTHIVTPIDDVLVDDPSVPNYRYGRRVKIIARTSREDFIPVSTTIWTRLNFSGITQGNACKIQNISNVGNIEELQYDIWNRFEGHFVQDEQLSETTTKSLLAELKHTNPDLMVTEGGLFLVAHEVRERNQKIVREKKTWARSNNLLQCEVCSFSFSEVYNQDYIECHHIEPIGQTGLRQTTLDDLALVCSNCHRMLHSKFDGTFLTIQQLKERMTYIQQTV